VFDVADALAAPLGIVVEPVFPQDTISTFDGHAHVLCTTTTALATVGAAQKKSQSESTLLPNCHLSR
jgi:hypothetical protein